ncbi:hypothetical protein BC008_13605 [Mastigocoleus testarum BC008]|uniref:Uncharacterized protein n=2 Tax=Mastigocoleus TaxID=996924 RepID=A0A0V7ZGY4_9CYAN|nr:hypothetical protein BC008_13605 [Mastigocoleus testarum BC008]
MFALQQRLHVIFKMKQQPPIVVIAEFRDKKSQISSLPKRTQAELADERKSRRNQLISVLLVILMIKALFLTTFLVNRISESNGKKYCISMAIVSF